MKYEKLIVTIILSALVFSLFGCKTKMESEDAIISNNNVTQAADNKEFVKQNNKTDDDTISQNPKFRTIKTKIKQIPPYQAHRLTKQKSKMIKI